MVEGQRLQMEKNPTQITDSKVHGVAEAVLSHLQLQVAVKLNM